MDKQQAADGWHKLPFGDPFLDLEGVAHRDEGLYALCFEEVAHGQFAAIGDTHGIPSHRVVRALYGGDGRGRLHAGRLLWWGKGNRFFYTCSLFI